MVHALADVRVSKTNFTELNLYRGMRVNFTAFRPMIWHATDVLPTCCWHAADLLPTCCWHAVDLLHTCCWHAADLLPTCCWPAPHMLLTCSSHAADMLLTCFPHVADMLLRCIWHAAEMQLTCCWDAADMIVSLSKCCLLSVTVSLLPRSAYCTVHIYFLWQYGKFQNDPVIFINQNVHTFLFCCITSVKYLVFIST